MNRQTLSIAISNERANYNSRVTEFDNELYRLRNDINAILELHHGAKEEYPDILHSELQAVKDLRERLIKIEGEMRGDDIGDE